MNCVAVKEETGETNVDTDTNIKVESSCTPKLELFVPEEKNGSVLVAPLPSESKTSPLVKVKEELCEQEDNGLVHLSYDKFNLEKLPKEYQDTYTSYIKEVEALSSIPITKSISDDYIENFQHFNMRYYEDKYCTEFGVNRDLGNCDINVRIHTNKLMLVALASGNDIILNSKPIVHISFVINDNDRANVCLRGKKKRGSKAVERGTILCQVKCQDDDKLYNIRSGVAGRIIEINEHIKTKPDLLRTEPKGLGFVAVLAPKDKEGENLSHLLSEDEYLHYVVQRH